MRRKSPDDKFPLRKRKRDSQDTRRKGIFMIYVSREEKESEEELIFLLPRQEGNEESSGELMYCKSASSRSSL